MKKTEVHSITSSDPGLDTTLTRALYFLVEENSLSDLRSR